MTTAGSGADEPAAPQSLWQRLTYLLWRGPGARRVGRYALVNGAFGVPASIAQIALMIFIYEQAFGPANTLVLNLLFVIDLELTLTRNYLLNSRFIWGIAPSWKRFQHAHVATIGAWLVGLVAFNVTIWLTDSALLGRLASAIASFPAAYIYNDLRTFRR